MMQSLPSEYIHATSSHSPSHLNLDLVDPEFPSEPPKIKGNVLGLNAFRSLVGYASNEERF